MSKLKKYDLKGKEVGEVSLDEAFLNAPANPQMVKDYIVAIRANARQWSANTKGRAEVVHTTKKPHKQKGTGSARQGNLVTSQFRGGGIVFGPKPKFNQHVRINQKERRLAIRSLIVEKIKEARVFILEDSAIGLDKPETKAVAGFIKQLKIGGRKVLFVGDASFEDVAGMKMPVSSDKHNGFKLSMRNLPKSAFALAPNVNGYDLLTAHHIVLSESALKQLQEIYK